MAQPKYTDARVKAICLQELSRAQGYQADEIEANREAALNYYNGKPRGDEVEGLSQAQSLDVADMVEATLSFIVPALTAESAVQFAALGAEDEEKAAQESRVVQAMVRAGGSNSYLAIQQAAKDALLTRLGVLKVWVQEKSTVKRETFGLGGDDDAPDVEQLAVLLAPEKPNEVKAIGSQKRMPHKKGGGWQVEIKTTCTYRKLRIGAVAPENFTWSPEATEWDLERTRFCAERQYVSRSELVEEGVPESEVERLPAVGVETRQDARARKRSSNIDLAAEDYWAELVEVQRCHVMLGTGEEGRAERWLVSLAGNRLLSKEIEHCVPFALGVAILAGHSLQGVSLFDKLRQVQDVKTGFLRAWLNNAQFVVRPRAALLENAVNEDDFYNVEVGGGVKVQRQGAIEWLQVPDIGPSCMGAMAYMDKVRAERGGASLDLLSPELQLNSPTAAGTEREIGVKEQLAALMARNLSETMLRSAFLISHKLARYEMGDHVEVASRGEWITDTPSAWPERDDATVIIGMSPGERSRRMNALGAVVAQQEKLLLAGQDGVLVTIPQFHKAQADWMRAAGIDAPETYFTDPQSKPAQEAAQAKKAEAQSMGRAQAELLKAMEAMRAQVKAFESQVEYSFKYWQELLHAELEEMKLLGTATLGLRTAKMGAAQRSAELEQGAASTAQGAGATAAAPAPEAGKIPMAAPGNA